MAKVPEVLKEQIEGFEEIIQVLNGLIDGSKIKLDYYDQKFLEKLSTIRKDGLELRDKIQIFKNDLEHAVTQEYGGGANSRFAGKGPGVKTWRNVAAAKKVVDSFVARTVTYE